MQAVADEVVALLARAQGGHASMRALTLPKSRMGLWSNTCAPYTDSEWKMVVTPCDTSSRSLYSDVDRSMTTLGRGEATFST